MSQHTLAPNGSSPEALKVHAEGLARVLGLTQKQTDILVSEIRNALCPATMSVMGIEGCKESGAVDPEDVSDLKVSHARVLALMSALDRATR